MKRFFKEFKEFAIKENMVDIAIGVILGTAFNKVVDVLVKDIISPPLLILTNQVNYADQKVVLKEASEGVSEIAIGYGHLVEALVDFLIIGLTVFLVVKGMNRFKSRAQDPKDPTEETPREIELLSRIEQLMEEQNQLLRQREK